MTNLLKFQVQSRFLRLSAVDEHLEATWPFEGKHSKQFEAYVSCCSPFMCS